MKLVRLHWMPKKGWHLSADRKMNRPRVAMHPVSHWTSLMLRGSLISNMAWILSRLAFIPRLLIMKPRNLLDLTANMRFFRMSFMPNFQGMLKVFRRS